MRRTDERCSVDGGRVSATRRSRTTPVACLALAMLLVLLAPGMAAGAIPPAPTPTSSSPPAVAGTPALGQTLTCSPGTWANNPSAFAYVWLRDGSPIAGQTASTYVVQSADRGHSISCTVTASNSGGEYTIVGLASGSYKVQFSAAESGLNYLKQYFSNQPTPAGATPLTVTAPSAIGNVDAALQPGGQISGKVTAAAGGAPVAEVFVCALASESEGCAITNAAGNYTIMGLATGSYTLQLFSFANLFGEGEGANYLFQSVSGVAVNAPNTTTNVNVSLTAGGQISGKVSSAASHEPVPAFVCAFNTEEQGGCQFTNEHGEYTISGLATGSYRVQFLAMAGNYLVQYYNGKASLGEAEAVPVTAGSRTSKIEAELQAGGQISGTVTDASTLAGIANVTACAFAGSEIAGCANTKANGEYTIPGLPTGSYSVGFSPSQGNYLSQSQSGISVTAPNTTSGVSAALQPGGQISGKVTDAGTHAALSGVTVCVTGVRCASTNGAGEYTVGGLSSSTYEVSFVPRESNYLSQVLQGVSVTVPNTTANVDAELHPGGQIQGRVTAASSGLGIGGIEACAYEAGSGRFIRCATTNATGGSASATSGAVAVLAATSAFKQARKPVFDAKTDDLDFFFEVGNPGTFSFNLSFANSDVGFADSLGISLAEGGAAARAVVDDAQTARAKHGKAKGCKAGKVKHKGRCVAARVPFSKGSQSVSSGTVEVQVHADAKAVKALKTGHTLHVSGMFTFQSAFGGAPVAHAESAVVHPPKKKKGKKRGRK